MGETAAHAHMGHKKWWMTYYQRPLEQRRADYLRAMPDLMVFKPEPSVEQRKQVLMGKAVEAGFTPKALKELEEKMKDIQFMNADELAPIAEMFARLAVQSSSNGTKYEVVQVKADDEVQITKLLTEGFEFVDRVARAR